MRRAEQQAGEGKVFEENRGENAMRIIENGQLTEEYSSLSLAAIEVPERPSHKWTFQRLRRNLVQGWCSCGFVIHHKTTRVVIQELKEHEKKRSNGWDDRLALKRLITKTLTASPVHWLVRRVIIKGKLNIMKKKITYQPLNREDISNPFRHIPYEERLKQSDVIDLRDNHTIEELPNGRIKVVPIDSNKKFE